MCKRPVVFPWSHSSLLALRIFSPPLTQSSPCLSGIGVICVCTVHRELVCSTCWFRTSMLIFNYYTKLPWWGFKDAQCTFKNKPTLWQFLTCIWYILVIPTNPPSYCPTPLPPNLTNNPLQVFCFSVFFLLYDAPRLIGPTHRHECGAIPWSVNSSQVNV